ncbi:Adrenodoxin-like protein 2, mitochondrial [Balamuthia mandrillaris]
MNVAGVFVRSSPRLVPSSSLWRTQMGCSSSNTFRSAAGGLFSSSSSRLFSAGTATRNDAAPQKTGPAKKKTIKITYVNKDGSETHADAPIGENALIVAHANDVDLEGACECSLACSTCHVILDQEYYDKLSAPSEEEEDMLDLAFGLTETSRLGCQIIMKPELEGMRLKLPAATRNLYVDGHKPKPH